MEQRDYYTLQITLETLALLYGLVPSRFPMHPWFSLLSPTDFCAFSFSNPKIFMSVSSKTQICLHKSHMTTFVWLYSSLWIFSSKTHLWILLLSLLLDLDELYMEFLIHLFVDFWTTLGRHSLTIINNYWLFKGHFLSCMVTICPLYMEHSYR